MKNKQIILFTISIFIPFLSFAHGGRLNSQGCHNDRKNNSYHCHRPQAQTITAPVVKVGYDRKNWKHWIDEDKDCQNTRHELLISTSLIKPTLDLKGCKVIAGKWYGKYSNQYYTDPTKLDIDHIIPLKEVYLSGGNKWTKKQKEDYANDYNILIPVLARENRQKGVKDPANWMPSNADYHCEYVKKWVDIKTKYNLNYDEKEIEFIKNNKCD